MRIQKKHFFLFLILAAALSLLACDNKKHLRDLRDYVARLQQNIILPKKQLNQKTTSSVPVVIYQPNKTRSPFGGTIYNLEGTSNPLLLFPLNILRYKGIVIEGTEVSGYILAPDTKLYRVKIGDSIGDHYGKILNILPDRVEVKEPITEQGKPSTQRIVTLQLKDAG